ncbi:hypothetical protein RIB2604_00802060 [Aspergillus luchuensis]|uniref:VOC domain-containing protein n=1 Tax=Aspergillus kawachii TaxID=1069201 RepID=A0A146F4S5_ASPKA|nr:hypothetical protein RIB2604_00802060 [Aspergillus luchuensis]
MAPSTATAPGGLNHYAYATNDMVKTHKFWTEVMRCKFLGAQRQGGEPDKYSGETLGSFLHCFYGLADGSAVAFFELANNFTKTDDGIPAFTKHLALSVNSRDELYDWMAHFKSCGVDVKGEIDHDGLWYSIYVIDPNGQMVELTWQSRAFNEKDVEEGLEIMRQWREDKAGVLLTHKVATHHRLTFQSGVFNMWLEYG